MSSRGSRKWATVLVASLVLSGPMLFVQRAEATLWPPATSPDMTRIALHSLGCWAHMCAEYSIWKHTLTWKYVGIIRTWWYYGGADLIQSEFIVYRPPGYFAPGEGSRGSNDPYGYLPRHLQGVEYFSGDNIPQLDRLGWTSPWVEFPLTSVPATWQAYGTEDSYVNWWWTSDPSCWKPGNRDIRQGATFATPNGGLSAPASGSWIWVWVYYHSRDTNWFGGCSGGTYYSVGYERFYIA